MVGHAARRLRREKVAQYVRRAGGAREALDAAAEKFGVTVNTVRTACREHGVAYVAAVSHESPASTYKIIAALFTTARMDDIAAKHRVSKAFVSQVYARCRKAGIPVPERKRGVKPC